MRKIRLDDSCLNHLTNIPVGFTRKSSYIHTFWEITYKNIIILLIGGAYAPDATCIATPLRQSTRVRVYARVTVTLTPQPWYVTLTLVLRRRNRHTKKKFLGQGFQKLEPEQDRQTDATERIITPRAVKMNKNQSVDGQIVKKIRQLLNFWVGRLYPSALTTWIK